jgi:hypothetical protein
MPQMMPEGLPERAGWSRYDFSQWTDGKAWKFLRGEDYESSTESFRDNLRRWARSNGFEVTIRSIPATDERGRPLPRNQADPIGLGVCFSATNGKAAAAEETEKRAASAPRAA